MMHKDVERDGLSQAFCEHVHSTGIFSAVAYPYIPIKNLQKYVAEIKPSILAFFAAGASATITV